MSSHSPRSAAEDRYRTPASRSPRVWSVFAARQNDRVGSIVALRHPATDPPMAARSTAGGPLGRWPGLPSAEGEPHRRFPGALGSKFRGCAISGAVATRTSAQKRVILVITPPDIRILVIATRHGCGELRKFDAGGRAEVPGDFGDYSIVTQTRRRQSRSDGLELRILDDHRPQVLSVLRISTGGQQCAEESGCHQDQQTMRRRSRGCCHRLFPAKSSPRSGRRQNTIEGSNTADSIGARSSVSSLIILDMYTTFSAASMTAHNTMPMMGSTSMSVLSGSGPL